METKLSKYPSYSYTHTSFRAGSGGSGCRMFFTSEEVAEIDTIPVERLRMEEIFLAGVRSLADEAKNRQVEYEAWKLRGVANMKKPEGAL